MKAWLLWTSIPPRARSIAVSLRGLDEMREQNQEFSQIRGTRYCALPSKSKTSSISINQSSPNPNKHKESACYIINVIGLAKEIVEARC